MRGGEFSSISVSELERIRCDHGQVWCLVLCIVSRHASFAEKQR